MNRIRKNIITLLILEAALLLLTLCTVCSLAVFANRMSERFASEATSRYNFYNSHLKTDIDARKIKETVVIAAKCLNEELKAQNNLFATESKMLSNFSWQIGAGFCTLMFINLCLVIANFKHLSRFSDKTTDVSSPNANR